LTAASSAAAPLEAYGRLPSIEMLSLSPSGEQVAMIWTDGDDRKVVVRQLSDGKITNVISAGGAKVRAMEWAGAKHLIVTTSRTGGLRNFTANRNENFTALAIDLSNNKSRQLLASTPNSLSIVADYPEVRIRGGEPMVFMQGYSLTTFEGRISIFRQNPAAGPARLDVDGFPDTRDWVLDASGEPIAQTVYNAQADRWTLHHRKGGLWPEVRRLERQETYPHLLGLGRDGKSVLVEELVDGAPVLKELAPDGTWGEPIKLRRSGSAIFDPVTHALIGYAATVGDRTSYFFFKDEDQANWNALVGAYPGQTVTLASWSNDRSKIAVYLEGRNGPSYALVDLKNRKASSLGSVYDQLTSADVAAVQPVRYKAADGLDLRGYLTLPNGREAKGLPLIVLPHGGPAARDTGAFDWWSQALASRGYAVLQVNFRGSDGYGREFLEAGYGEWGRKMQTDLSDGVRHLAGQGVIDPSRVCIVGASYGGYAALAGPTLDPGVYRCAASVAGISDLRRFANWLKDERSVAAVRYFTKFVGAESRRDPALSQVSPVAHVSRVNVPVLLVHGKDDLIVPIEQSKVMADALRGADKPVEFVVLEGEDHWLSQSKTRLQMLTSVVAFLEKHNPPK
jgi:dipeptidyl aminopeptidase/acylaminoacyl peptidase